MFWKKKSELQSLHPIIKISYLERQWDELRLNEITVDLAENMLILQRKDIPYDIHIRNGSVEITIEILKEISSNPTVAGVLAATVAAIVGKVTTRKIESRKVTTNKSARILVGLNSLISNNPEFKISKIDMIWKDDNDHELGVEKLVVRFLYKKESEVKSITYDVSADNLRAIDEE